MATLAVPPAEPSVQHDDASRPHSTGTTEHSVSRPSKQKSEQIAQTLVLAMLFACPALMCVRSAAVQDPDIWWHLRVGELITQHHAILRVEPFSRGFAGTPWLAYSWLFEVLVFKLYQWFGLVGIVGYSAGMVLGITIALYHIVRRYQADFSFAILLTFAACYGCGHLLTPRPWQFSILFFVLELDILMHVRKTGRLLQLAWLPVLFALWANTHIEYIYGLFVLGLAFLESVVATRQSAPDTQLSPLAMGSAALAGGLATLANPFGWRIYSVVYNLVTQGGGLRQVSEMQAIPFRNVVDYCVLFLALGSVGALAWRRRFPVFESGLLLFAIVMAFRSQRDAWLIPAVAVVVLATSIPPRKGLRDIQLPRFASVCAVAISICVVIAGLVMLRGKKAELEAQVANTLPVHAVEAVRAKGYAGPLFNDFNWGGYLIWALRQPVTIDGRTNLYGNDGMDRSIATWNGAPDWNTDPSLTSAGLVIGPARSALTQLLRTDSRFRLVYEDKVAAVFVSQKAPQ